MKIFSYFILVLFKYLRLFLLSACSFLYLNSKIVYCQENDGKKNKEDQKNQLLSDLNIDDSIKNSIVKKIFDQAVNLYLVVNEISNLHKENLELKKVLDENAFRFFYKNIRFFDTGTFFSYNFSGHVLGKKYCLKTINHISISIGSFFSQIMPAYEKKYPKAVLL